jgi:hypothetical protein
MMLIKTFAKAYAAGTTPSPKAHAENRFEAKA